ncbi:MAG: recombinase family protein [Myxococcales bacterium]|nr:recombinase family protein [Myxococcales bacterium]
MRAVIYCRVSTKEQVENFSLEAQERASRDYCQRNNLEIAEVFVEKGESAKTAHQPELQRLLAYLSQAPNHGRSSSLLCN